MENMTLEQALDFLASNCTVVFKPISEEMTRLKAENDNLRETVNSTQIIVNDLVMQSMSIK